MHIWENLKTAWLINQTEVIFVLAALYLIKCFGTQALLTNFSYVLEILSYAKNATFDWGCWFISYYPPDF